LIDITKLRSGAILAWLGLLGCAAQGSAPQMPVARTGTATVARAPAAPVPAAIQPGGGDAQRLEELWQKRTHDSFGSDFTLGPGDLLEISVPLEQLQHREVRVSAHDTIDLPLVGELSVKGMTEQSLTDSLRKRLSVYMYDPPVSLFVKDYGSREVAVVGAIEKPGLYTLTSGSDTLMDMVNRAGGMTKEAAATIVFVPAGAGGRALEGASFIGLVQPRDGAQMPASASRVPETGATGSSAENAQRSTPIENEKPGAVQPVAAAAAPRADANSFRPMVSKLHPITISMSDPNQQQYLGMPARPGDVLIIPSAGQVTVGGWVQTPGAYQITPGMTALSAISAAGGPLFSSTAEVLRTAPNGERLSIPVHLSKVQAGEETDVPVQSGDVVMVDRSAAGAIPYSIYSLFMRFGTGLAFPVP
jgi:protein involved in polysaccharide export with SLBB domain